MVFSKGHYNDQKCVHLPANSGQTSVNFDIHLGKCGMSSSDASSQHPNSIQMQQQLAASGQQQQPNGLYIENTIIIQYDPQVQEIYDQARKLRCTWYDYYEKSVTFRPYSVEMLDAVTANFLGDNIQCWMQIQVGKGPWSSEVAGIVKIGQTMTMVLAIKDDENRFDMLVRNCMAHDGKHQPIQLVDEYGCVARPKIMAKFQKVRNFGPTATVVSYAHFQAFKFPDSMNVHFQCVIQVCRYECPEPVCGSNSASSGGQSGGGGGEIGGSSGSTGNGGDYTASGTEIVSSKEPPMGAMTGINQGGYFLANNSMAGGSHAINLKLDESQGRVQVKLDTSMMAPGVGGGGGSGRPAPGSGGPLPPHLLHAASSDGTAAALGPAPVPPGYVPARPSSATSGAHLSSYYKQPAVVTTGGQQQRMPQGGATTTTNGRPPMLNGGGMRQQLAPPGAQRSTHFSSPYSHPQQQQQQQQPLTHRFYHQTATNRLGDLPPEVEDPLNKQQEGVAVPLSLLAVPRGLRTSQRQRRSISDQQLNLTLATQNHPKSHIASQTRTARHSRADESTAIKTQKTIQVVSPDDVAFSLLDGSEEGAGPAVISGSQQQRRSYQQGEPLNTVCFSATRLVVAILVTLAALAAGLVIVAYLVMRQRAAGKLEADKLSGLYDPSADLYGTHQQQLPVSVQQQQQQHQQVAAEAVYGEVASVAAAAASMQIALRRQQEEIRQRNNYLARLYSQFVPANYWR